MHVLVTGAGGFVGRALVQRLLSDRNATPEPLTRLTAIDRLPEAGTAGFDDGAPNSAAPTAATSRPQPSPAVGAGDPRLRWLAGDFADPALLTGALSPAPAWVFHLASVPGGLAEREPALGLQANLLGPIGLLQALAGHAGTPGDEPPPAAPNGRQMGGQIGRQVGTSGGAAVAPPRVVFASSIAVYGQMSAVDGGVDESMPARPLTSYGAHKLMTEILLADLSRQGRLDGVSLRLPGIVARPAAASGHGSAFMSDLLRQLLAGRPYLCPVSAAAQCWWMSLRCCVDNLLHAARLPPERLPPSRCVQLPVITATVRELADAIEVSTGRPADLRWQPDAAIETRFGRQPRLATPLARSLGFADDGSLQALVGAAGVGDGFAC